MPTLVAILLKVANELEQLAKSSMPKGKVVREWFSDGVYYREIILNGKKVLSRFDFRSRSLTVC